MAAIAQWCFRRRFTVIALWVVALAGFGAGFSVVGPAYNDDFSLPGTDSAKAFELLEKSFPRQSGEIDTVVWRAEAGTVRDAAIKDRMNRILEEIKRIEHIAGVISPYTPEGEAQISRDGRIAYATVELDTRSGGLPKDAVKEMVGTAQDGRTGGLQVEVGGTTVAEATSKAGSNSELYGLIAAAIILLIAFGSLVSMLLPLVTAVFALGCGLLVIGLASHPLSVATFSPQLATLIGLGVGIDYALFIVTRHRNGLRIGRTPQEAAVTALNTSGRAVIFAGTTVCIALLGLLVLNVSFLSGIAIASAITVLFTIAAAVTLLPALLSLAGGRVLNRRERRRLDARGPTNTETRTGLWARWADFSARRSAPLAIVATVIMVAMLAPVFGLRLGFSDQGTQPEGSTTREAYDMLATGFGPGFNGPLTLVAEIRTPMDKAAFERLAAQVKGVKGVARVGRPVIAPQGTTGILEVTPASSPQDKATSDLIERLRDGVVPAAENGRSLRVHIGGEKGVADDFAAVIAEKLPLFLLIVVSLGCLLLLLAFRSVLVPLTAAVMNLLAAGATFGLMVTVFQWGWGDPPLEVGKGPIEAFLPVFMMAMLFGLSMDYQVFLVSRMHEEWVNSHDNTRSVKAGVTETSRVITAAAAIMIFVFGSFVLGGERTIAEVGLGLAAAILLDAFLLRTMLVPTIMHLLGRSNWWLPRRVDRVLPHLSVEPHETPPAGHR